jgi:pimeloyl-ACP methyl ester carboxylesterase
MAAARGLAISGIALYEPPFLVNDGYPQRSRDISVRLTELIASGRRGDAVELYQTELVGIPAEIVAQVRHAPFRPALETIAHTLIYDATILSDMPVLAEQLPSITITTLAISGGDSPVFLRQVTQAVADTLPNAQRNEDCEQAHGALWR